MNYDLCDLLNRKMESQFSYFNENFNKSIFKHQNFLDNYLQKYFENEYLEILEKENTNNDIYAHWVYRNGKFSDQINDFEVASKKITREIANMTYSNSPSVDIMYFSGVLKLIYIKNKAIYIETCTKPTLDQLMSIKDFQNKNLDKNDKIFWRIIDKRNRNTFHDGFGLDNLFSFKWARIK